MPKLYLNVSKERKAFKKSLGQANHFLITALVGLDYIRNNNVKCPEDFSTSWNPKNKSFSVDRSRQYILNSSMAWAVDCLDAYFSMCNQNPKLIENKMLLDKINGTRRSVNEKLMTFVEYLGIEIEEFGIYVSMAALAIQWRNNTMHFGAHNTIDVIYRDKLLNFEGRIKDLFCGLDIIKTLNSFEKGKDPTFKEVTSLIRGIHRLVEMVDLRLLSEIDINRYAHDIINHHFKKYKLTYKSVLALPSDKRNTKILNILTNNSFSYDKRYEKSQLIDIDDIISSWEKQ